MSLLSDFRDELFYSSSKSSGCSFGFFNITSLKRIPQTLFAYNFGDIRGKKCNGSNKESFFEKVYLGLGVNEL